MKVYHYHHETGELVSSNDARVAPFRENLPDTDETKFLCPANATFIVPPEKVEGFAPAFINGAWVQVEDHRGKEGFVGYGIPKVITELGPLPKEWSITEPTKPREIIRNEILAQIVSIEAGQHRTIREVTLGKEGAMEKLQALDDQIAELRAQLV